MNWGHKITIAFVAFAAIIISMVIISMSQDVNLVEPNYYEEELAYQEQIDKMNNYSRLTQKPEIIVESGSITVKFPVSGHKVDNGWVKLYRPSEPSLDKTYDISPGVGESMIIPLQSSKKGFWKLKIQWMSQGKAYFHEQSLVI